MKPSLRTLAILLTMHFVGLAHGGQISDTFDSVPSGVQCGGTWTNQNIVLNFAPTVAAEDGSGGYCAFEVDPGYIWLYPSRLRLDFSMLPRPVSRIEADIYDSCGSGCTVLFAYHGTTNIGQVGNPTVHAQTLSLDFIGQHPDTCAVRSFEAMVKEIRIFTEDPSGVRLSIQETNGSIAVLWPTNAANYILEKTVDLKNASGWMIESNNIYLEGTNFVHRPSTPLPAEFLRLRLN